MAAPTDLPSRESLQAVMELACQAPSLHNTQPWRWIVHGRYVELYHDPDRMLPFTDAVGRQMVISCGAALHHAHIALAALGWTTTLDRMPETDHPSHLATLTVTGWSAPGERESAMAAAVGRRRSDRLPFDAPSKGALALSELRDVAATFDIGLEQLTDPDRRKLELVSEQAASMRRYDQQYQDELRWWSGHSPSADGVPREALLSRREYERVAVGRQFPAADRMERRDEIPEDHAAVLVLSTMRDSLPLWLRCGEALSAVLLTCTANGLVTCPLTHLTELPTIRAMITDLLDDQHRVPQVLVRAGVVEDVPAYRTTSRRPLADMVTFIDDW